MVNGRNTNPRYLSETTSSYIWILIWQRDCGCGLPYTVTLFLLNCSSFTRKSCILEPASTYTLYWHQDTWPPVMWCRTRMRQSMTCYLQETRALVLRAQLNPLKPELNPICYLLALLGAHHFLHVSRIRVKLLTLK